MAIIISAIGDGVVESSANQIRFTVTLTEAAVDAVTINYRTLLGTASNADLFYTATSANNNGTVTFAPGETSKDVLIYTTNDALDERDEIIVLELYDPSEGTFEHGTATYRASGVVLDNDGAGSNLAFLVSDPVITEGDSGQKMAVFEVRLSQPAPSAFSATYTTINGTAVAGSDYVATSGTINFVPGQDVALVSVPIIGNTLSEASEVFSLAITVPNSPSIGTEGTVGTATILDEDTGSGPVISLSAGSAVVESSANQIRFVVTLSEAAVDAVTVNYRTLLGTASNADLFYTSTSANNNGTVTFAPGETSKDVLIYTTNDALDERDENIVLELYDPLGARLEGGLPVVRQSGVILDNDGAGSNLAFFVSDPVIVEGDSGQKMAVFEVRLSQPAPSAFSATYTTIDATAVAGSDYVATSGTVNFVPGQDVAFVSVPVIGNTLSEPSEVFSLAVTVPNSPSIGTDGAVGTATILDNDTGSGPVISLSTGSAALESSANQIRFVVTLSEAAVDAVTVNYATVLGTASNADLFYSSTSPNNNGTVTFAPGETSKDVLIYATGDALDERDESMFLVLSNPVNAVFAGGQPSLRAAGVIHDGDGAGLNVSLVATNASVSEGSANAQMQLLVELTRPATAPITFNVSTTNGTAAANADFQLVNTTVTFAAGQTVAAVKINILADRVSETNETFAVNFSLASGPFPAGVIPSAQVTIRPGPIVGDAGNNILNGGIYNDSIFGLDGNDQLNGLGGNDVLTGGNGADTLNGGVGADNMRGGAGNDVYVVDNAADIINESIAGSTGVDTVQSAISFSLANTARVFGAVENLTLLGAGNISGTGNALNNVITGNTGANVLNGGAGNDTLNGGAGNDTLNGGAGADNMRGGAGNDVYIVDNAADIINESIAGSNGVDTVQSAISFSLANTTRVFGAVENLSLLGAGNISGTGNALNNVITGNTGANVLNGGAGNDTLNGGGGADNMRGGAGNDVYVVDNAADIVNESIAGSNGLDTVRSAISFSLANTARVFGAVENLTLLGTGSLSGTGNALNNVLIGNTGANILNGGAGNDTLNGGGGADNMRGGAGNDVYVVDNASDVVNESIAGSNGVDTVQSAISFSLANTARVFGAVENLTLLGTGNLGGTGNGLSNVITGNTGANVLNGGAGNDRLNGGVGADNMRGGAGNDVYVVDNASDIVNESITGSTGVDTVQSAISFSLANTARVLGAVENLTLLGTGNISGTGNALNNVITGNTGANALNGGAGNDTLNGGAGNDTLNGGAGADNMRGGAGNDAYIVDNASDVVNESIAGSNGVDTVRSAISFSLANTARVLGAVENLTLLGTGNISGTGNALNNVITGNTGANVLNGGAGNDTLNGGGGADNMRGGAGNDVYVVDNASDIVNESIAGSTGVDTVQAAISFSLANTARVSGTVENLTLLGTGNIAGTGNALNNIITGNSGANTLNGGAGNDTLKGGVGNDTILGGGGADRLLGGRGNDSLNGNSGLDTVDYSEDFASGGTLGVIVNLLGNGSQAGLPADTARDGFGNTDTVTNIPNVIGTQFSDQIYGGNGVNTLSGGAGNDLLNGGLGNDVLIGGAGNDTFFFNSALGATNIDGIDDFVVVNDTIRLENAVFAALGVPGTLAAAAFHVGAAAADTSDRIIYNTATGAISYDTDGTGGTAAVQFATVSNGLSMTNADFFIV
ncbi:beta strand repeat-containing protein [Rhizobium herbae]